MKLSTLVTAPIKDRLSLLQLAREQHVSPPSPWQWAVKGVRGVKLPTVMIGGKRVTTRAAFTWWVAQITALANNEPQPMCDSDQIPDASAIEAAEREATDLLGL